MKPFHPEDSREAMEVRLTALLLGELSETEAAEVRKAVAQDAELATLHDRLRKTIHFVRETAADSKQAATADTKTQRLPETRRKDLLTRFKTAKPVEFSRPRWNFRQWLIPMGAAAMLAVMLMVFSKGRLEQNRYLAFGGGSDESSASPANAITAKKPSGTMTLAHSSVAVQNVNGPVAVSEPAVSVNGNAFQNRFAYARSGSAAPSTPAESASPMGGAAVDSYGMVADANGRDKGIALGIPEAQKPSAPQPLATTASAPPRKPTSMPAPVVRGSIARPAAESSVDFGDGDTSSQITRNSELAEAPTTDGTPTLFDRLGTDSESKPQDSTSRERQTVGKKMELARDKWAGRFQDAIQDGKDNVPLVGDLPVMGRLFSSTSPQAGETKTFSEASKSDVGGLAHMGSFDADLPESGSKRGEAGYAINSDQSALAQNTLGDAAKGNNQWYFRKDGATVGGFYDDNSATDLKNTVAKADEIEKERYVGGDAITTDGTSAYAYNLTVPKNLGEEQLKRVADADQDALTGKASRRAGSSGLSIQSKRVGSYGLSIQPSKKNPNKDSADTQGWRDDDSLTVGQNVSSLPQAQLEVAQNGKASATESAQTATEGVTEYLYANGSTTVSAGAMVVPAHEAMQEMANQPKLPEVINQPPPATLAFNQSGGNGYGGGGGMGGMGGGMGGAGFGGGRGGGGSVGRPAANRASAPSHGVHTAGIVGNVNEAIPADQIVTSGLRKTESQQDRGLQASSDVKLKAGKLAYTGNLDASGKSAKPATIGEAKRELDEMVRFRDVLQTKMTSEKSEAKQKALAQLEGKNVGQIIAPADTEDRPAPRLAPNAPVPQPEMPTRENAFSTFSLNVSDVSFKLAAASLDKGVMPDPSTVRSEEFINAFDYRDPEPAAGAPVAFAWDRARHPFAHNRDLLRFSVKTAALGRQAGCPLNIVLLLDNSGSMERADRVRIIRESLHVLASQLKPEDRLSVVTFSRISRLWVDGVSGIQAAQAVSQVDSLTPEGGTNLEEAMNLAYETALRHYQARGVNRVVLLTDGAANLGNVDPDALKAKVESNRKQGVALDCFGIGWEGYNDDLLENLSRNGDGRYGFINTPEAATTEFASQLAGALHVAASDVKVQVEFNPARVASWRQIGYAKHQLKKEQFRDNTVDAAEIAAQEAGNALYTVEVNPAGEGPLAVVRLRYKVPGTTDYREQEWTVPFTGNAPALEQSGTAMRLAASAGAFAEWLVSSPFSGEVTPDRLLNTLRGVPEVYGADNRPRQLETMIREAKSISGK